MRKITAGFTLMELMLAMAILAILSLIGIASYTTATIKSKDTQRKGEINQLVKAVESFNTDVGRYPLSNASNEILCYERTGTTVTSPNPECDPLNRKLYSNIDGVYTSYIVLPDGPDNYSRYVYIASPDGGSFTFYTALENANDKDLIIDPATNEPYTDPWGINCGVGSMQIPCNYKVTEEGLAKTL